MQIKVKRPGLLSTLQDLGRRGYQKYGVIVSGAMDTRSLRLANLLAGNAEGEACLEMTMSGPELELPAGLTLAITGGDFSPQIEGVPLPMNRPVYIKKACLLQFLRPRRGCRGYLAVRGGFAVPEVMGSKSTYLRAGLGGFCGRALERGDLLPLQGAAAFSRRGWRENQPCFSAPAWYIPGICPPAGEAELQVRYVRGAQWDAFAEMSQDAFRQQAFSVTNQSDRMGYRLEGENLRLREPLEMISEAVAFGTVQVPPDGNPIILMADRQTAGGYPKIAQVILADLPLLGQTSPGKKLRFSEVSLAEAQHIYRMQETALQALRRALAWKSA